MRSLMVLGAAASTLVLAGCNRETETAPAADEAAMSADAASAESAGTDASASASSGGESGGGAPDAGAMSETMDPAGSASAPAPGAMGPVTQDTRDNAKMAAEETNLHPKPPGQH